MTPPKYHRLNPRNAESVRQKIKVIKLLNRLQNHALGEIEMTSTQIDSAKFLINKITPNAPEKKELEVNGKMEVVWPLPKTSLDQ